MLASSFHLDCLPLFLVGAVLMGRGKDEAQDLFSNFQLLNCGSYLSQKHTSWNLEVGQF